MKQSLALFVAVLVYAGQAFGCGDISSEEMKKLMVKSVHTRVLKSGSTIIDTKLNPSNFFCAGDEFILVAPGINAYTDLAHPTVLKNDSGDCDDYSQEFFENVFKQSQEIGGAHMWVQLSEEIQLITDAEGNKKCQKSLVEFIDVAEAACMVDVKTIPLEELPLTACKK